MGLLFTLSPLQRAASTSTPPPSGRMPHRAVPVADTHSIRFSTHQLPAADRCGPAATGAAAARLRSGAPAVPGPKAAPPPPAPPQSPAVCCPQPHRRRPLRSPGRRQQPLQSHLVPGDRRRRRHWTRTTEGLCALMIPRLTTFLHEFHRGKVSLCCLAKLKLQAFNVSVPGMQACHT